MLEYKYLMKVAIDFGSTNTIMAWRVYDIQEDGSLVISENLNPIRSIKRIPSMMIFKDENRNNEGVRGDIYGTAAAEVVRNSNIPPVVCDNFKQKLYVASPDTEEYQKGIELCTRFFGFLREEYKQEMYNILPAHVTQSLKVVLYLSTPVRAHPTHRSLMRKIAQNAGFTEENGITEICTDYDEARCVVRYAMEQRKEDMQDILVKATQPDGAVLLFVDVGGSTMDVSLENLRMSSDGTEIMDNIGFWPNADVRYPLGGAQIDEAIKDYLVKEGYANEAFTREKWNQGDGKFRFRTFKEENNLRLLSGQSIDKLGKIASVCYDYDEDIIPEKNYNKGTRKIDQSTYENVICGEYIDMMLGALKDLFVNQRTVAGKAPITPAEVDAIFLAGDGSRLYFIGQILKGAKADRDPGFTQIKNEPRRLFDHWNDPSQCCALGALAEQEKMVTLSYAKESYFAELSVYEHEGITDEQLNMAAMKKGIISKKHYLIYEDKIPISGKYQSLPQESSKEVTFPYEDHAQEYLSIRIAVQRLKENGVIEQVGEPMIITQKRKMDELLSSIRKGASVLAFLLGGPVGWMAYKMSDTLFGDEEKDPKDGNAHKDGKTRDSVNIEASMKCHFALAENNQLTTEVMLTSKHFTLPVETISMDI